MVAGGAAAVPAHTLYSPRRRWLLLAMLFLVAMSNYIDRTVISVLLEPIKKEFGASDTQLGLLSGIAFAFFYATLGIPIARWADRGNRRTIIAVCLSVWSVMTVLCGLSQTFWQLALARVGVGAGEAGAIPPAQSLIADYFPPEKRAIALAIFTAAATAGYLGAFVGGAWLVQAYGWRGAFITVGLPGLLLALLTHVVLKEPREVLGFARRESGGGDAASFGTVLRELAAKRSYVLSVTGLTLYAFMAYGVLVFFPSYMVRTMGIPLTQVGTGYGAVTAVSALIGTLGGGWLAGRLGTRDPRWYAWLPAAACAIAWPVYLGAFLHATTFNTFLVYAFVAGVLLSGGLPSIFTAIHAVCGSSRRAVAVAVMLFMMSLVGSGLGPVVTGVLSDLFAQTQGANALRLALVAAMTALLPSAYALYLAGRAVPRDMEP